MISYLDVICELNYNLKCLQYIFRHITEHNSAKISKSYGLLWLYHGFTLNPKGSHFDKMCKGQLQNPTACWLAVPAGSIVLNNDNLPELDRTAGQPAVEFWSRPLQMCKDVIGK